MIGGKVKLTNMSLKWEKSPTIMLYFFKLFLKKFNFSFNRVIVNCDLQQIYICFI
jgi:hypothetical protein